MIKKLILIGCVFFLGCIDTQTKPREVNAQTPYSPHSKVVTYRFEKIKISGMTYGVWYCDDGYTEPGAITVVNLTKDSLEVALLNSKL